MAATAPSGRRLAHLSMCFFTAIALASSGCFLTGRGCWQYWCWSLRRGLEIATVCS